MDFEKIREKRPGQIRVT